ncbi:DUF4129 domain-containing protein [Allobranchiibius huperziae]|uniref:Protein-glutamine gamma-glutamyltransferase-like C-terminal domain-containing protein n=1 Tax=Allobranchiibius huperziae TaxID=1874116 RepID=A0A853DD33_9MICO|nr:DUF4129 domain-containing protein [Allobranchiibius huperziae]NYJ75476.1 hypothetical protein [Allobranchiibius huperziae]
MHLADATPLTPGGEQGRELLRRELSKSEYRQHKSLLQSVYDWIASRIDALLSGSTGTLPSIAWLIGLLLVILVVTLAVTGLRRGRVRARRQPDDAVLGDRSTSAEELRARATAAERAGDLDSATLDWFRAIAVRGVERALVDPAPGLTADEIARVLGARFPASSTGLSDAATVFDAVLYGGRTADAADCVRVRDLDSLLERTRPEPLRTGQLA